MFIVLLTLLPLFIPSVSAQEDCPINYECNNTNIPNSEVEIYCGKHDTNMTGRCCIFKNTIIGLDLRYCDVKILNISQPAFSQIEILDLRDNEYEKVTTHEFINLLKLNFLYLPQHIPCPGGHFSWNITNKDHNMTSCIEQLNPCLSLNISCGDAKNAECHHLGPGTAKCICSPGYFGYKCLNNGGFPVDIFTCSVIVPTIVLSVALWFIQGRDAYRKQS